MTMNEELKNVDQVDNDILPKGNSKERCDNVMVHIVDAMMGMGKSSYAIQMMQENTDTNYVYITPYLTEVTRIKTECPNRHFCEPINKGEGKLDSLHTLLQQGKNIASTHALFKMTTDETITLLKSKDYVLILDEVLDVVEQSHLKKNDIDVLLQMQMIRIADDKRVIWNEDKIDFDTKYNDLKEMCIQGNVYYVNGCMLMWTLPVEIFTAFSDVYVLTYLFKGQVQKAYYDLYNVKYTYHSVRKNDEGKYELCPYIEKYDMSEIRSKINILQDEKLNVIGDKESALSKSWYIKSDRNVVKQLKDNTSNFFKHKVDGKSKDNLWTTFKEYKGSLQGKGYTKGFIALNTRASNDYADKSNVAYLANRYVNPMITGFFYMHNVELDEDAFALNEMLQLIWRSRIRKGENINVYIPSRRMRELFEEWLKG